MKAWSTSSEVNSVSGDDAVDSTSWRKLGECNPTNSKGEREELTSKASILLFDGNLWLRLSRVSTSLRAGGGNLSSYFDREVPEIGDFSVLYWLTFERVFCPLFTRNLPAGRNTIDLTKEEGEVPT